MPTQKIQNDPVLKTYCEDAMVLRTGSFCIWVIIEIWKDRLFPRSFLRTKNFWW